MAATEQGPDRRDSTVGKFQKFLTNFTAFSQKCIEWLDPSTIIKWIPE